QQALRMCRQLYPTERFPSGHPDLTISLHNAGLGLYGQGEHSKGLDYCQQALQMQRRLYPRGQYPDGHPLLARSLNTLGLLVSAEGDQGLALDYHQQALEMYQQQTRTFVEAASEAEALNFLARLPPTRDAFLAASADPDRSQPDQQYALLWHGKALVSGVLLRRQQLLRGLTDDDSRRAAEELLDVRRLLARLLLAPPDASSKSRDKLMRE